MVVELPAFIGLLKNNSQSSGLIKEKKSFVAGGWVRDFFDKLIDKSRFNLPLLAAKDLPKARQDKRQARHISFF